MRKLFKKSLLCLVLSGVLIASMTGCSKKEEVTVDSLFTKAQETSKNTKSVDMTIGLDVDGDFSFGEETSMNIKLKADINSKAEDKKGAYVDGTVNMDMFGMSQEVPVKSYADLSEDGKVISYTYDKDTDSWEKSEDDSTNDMTASLSKMKDLDYSSVYKSLTLAKETETYNNVEAYHVSGDIKGTDLDSVISKLDDSMKESLKDVDLSSIVIGADFYFSTKDSSMIGASFDLAKTDFGKLTSELDKKAEGGTAKGDTVGDDIAREDSTGEPSTTEEPSITEEPATSEEPSSENNGVSFKTCKVEVKINSFDKYTFKVPDEVLNAVNKDEVSEDK